MNPEPQESMRQNGASIRAIRERDGLSIDDLVKRILVDHKVQISVPHLRSIENENKNASWVHLTAIAKALGVPLAAVRCNPHAEAVMSA